MKWFFSPKVEFTDGKIDLIPLHLSPPEKELGFGQEKNWRIAEHGNRQEIGRISYRPGESAAIYYFGHIGYHIDPQWRGNHYAEKACRLIKDEIYRSGKNCVVITCDPDNAASRKTCIALGCLWESEVPVDEYLQEKYDISPRKERYLWIVR